jgi:hypothetical protein
MNLQKLVKVIFLPATAKGTKNTLTRKGLPNSNIKITQQHLG